MTVEKKQSKDNKCVYLHMRLSDGSVFYVGSGNYPNRAYSTCKRSRKWSDIVASHGLLVEIVKHGLTKDMAIELERQIYEENKSTLVNAVTPRDVKRIDYDEIKTLVRYDEDSPTKLFWIKDVSTVAKTGSVAGNNLKNPSAYPKISVRHYSLLIHRIVYTLHFGTIPDGMVVDHIDGNKKNNNISNLRVTTPSQNCYNRKQSFDVLNPDLPQGVSRRQMQSGIVYEGYYHLDGKQHRKSFAVNKYGDELAKQNAIAWRSNKLTEHGIEVSERHFEKSSLEVINLQTNMFGHSMITRTTSGKSTKSDYVTFCVRRPKTFTRSFSINKYGLERAIELAVEARDEYLKTKEINNAYYNNRI